MKIIVLIHQKYFSILLSTSVFSKARHLDLGLVGYLGLFRWKGTSTYSKLEYGNVILSDAEYYLKKLTELKSVALLLEHISHVLMPQHREKRTWVFSLINTLGKTEQDRTRHAQASLRRLLKLGTDAIDAHCDAPLTDGTKCRWAEKGLQRRYKGGYHWATPDCKSSCKACKVDDFFMEHKERFKSIKEAIDGLDASLLTDELRQFSKVIGEAIEDPSILLNYKTGCKLIADAIIAVDSESYRNFATQNYKESQILTKVMGQRCYYLPNNPAHGVHIQEDGTDVS